MDGKRDSESGRGDARGAVPDPGGSEGSASTGSAGGTADSADSGSARPSGSAGEPGGTGLVEPIEAVEGVSAEHALFVGGRLRVVDPGALTLEEAVLLTREGARRRAGLDADEVRLRAAAVEAVHRERLAELTELARTSRGVYRPWAERLRAEFAETDPKVDWWATAAAATELGLSSCLCK